VRQAWLSEALLLGLLVLVGLLLSLLVGGAGWWLFLALAIFLSRHLYQLYRLERWLRVGRRRNPPESWGIWGEVFEHYYRLQRRYYKRKKRLGKVIREFRESTAAMPDGTMVLDGELRIMWFNEAARDLLRLSASRDLGQSVLNLVRSPLFKQYLASGQYEQSIHIASPVDDSRSLSARLIPYGTDQYLLLFRDVTRLTRLQTMRRDFVANASHELRSPLTVLAGYLETLADEQVLGPEWDMPMDEMRAQCRRMNSLVNDLLELSRLETEENDAPMDVEVDVCSLVERIIQYARSEDTAQHQFSFECSPAATLAGIERELHSAFSNLIINAMRYTADDGQISARWYGRAKGEWVFEVSDNGIGIAEKHIPFITQRFYRVDSSHSRKKGGTGLGLAIVKHVLQRHNSWLEVESEPGQGSTFRCVFPANRIRVTADENAAGGDPLTLSSR
jgi:two-component system, OmpR family, phosphate regulon sensor histidine kinase PhoR